MSPRTQQAVLRDASEADVAAVTAADREVFGAEAWPEAVVAGTVGSPTRTVVVAETGDGIAGYAVLSVAGGVADLERIAVLEGRRRTGLASALLDAVRARARARGAERLLLEVREDDRGAHAFYAAHGSVRLDRRRRYYRDGSDALVLQLPLGPAGEDIGG